MVPFEERGDEDRGDVVELRGVKKREEPLLVPRRVGVDRTVDPRRTVGFRLIERGDTDLGDTDLGDTDLGETDRVLDVTDRGERGTDRGTDLGDDLRVTLDRGDTERGALRRTARGVDRGVARCTERGALRRTARGAALGVARWTERGADR